MKLDFDNTHLYTTEAQIQKLCLQWINTVPGVKAWRQNTGGAKLKGFHVRFGVKGQADITGIAERGIRLEIEIKKNDGKLSEDQFAWLRMIREAGGIAFCCNSLEDCISNLKYWFREKGMQWSDSFGAY